MFLRKPVPIDLLLTYESSRYYYAQCPSSEFGFNHSKYWGATGHGMHGRLLSERRTPGKKLVHWTVRVGRPDRPPDGWMNPFVLQLEVEGTACDLPPDEVANDTRTVVQNLLEQTSVLALVPELGHGSDARFVAWSQLLSRRFGPLTAVERIVTGGGHTNRSRSDPERCLWPFLTLDELGGVFAIHNHGSQPRAGDQASPAFRWHPKRALAPNAHWLVQRVEQHWRTGTPLLWSEAHDETSGAAAPSDASMTFEVHESAHPVEQETTAQPVTFSRRTFRALPESFPDDKIRSLLDSISVFSDFCVEEQHALGSHPVVGQFFCALLSAMAEQKLLLPENLQHNWIQLLGENRIACDFPGFLNSLARRLVIPKSQLVAQLPETGGIENYYLDIVGSIPGGHRALVWTLLRDAPGEITERTIRRALGWWNVWHRSLFDDVADVKISFRAGGFSLGQSHLGEGTLGGERRNGSNGPVIRFSIPL